MSGWRHHLAWALVAAVAFAAGFLLGGEGTTKTRTITRPCTWGASSTGPVTKINGRIVSGPPRVKHTGCGPKP